MSSAERNQAGEGASFGAPDDPCESGFPSASKILEAIDNFELGFPKNRHPYLTSKKQFFIIQVGITKNPFFEVK
jgi:hypothetical protein